MDKKGNMKTVTGDLIAMAQEGKFDVIVHGCNCFCTMGAGIARSVKQNFPEAFEVDKQTVKGDKSKLGTLTSADILIKDGMTVTVVNAYTQYDFWSKKPINYKAVRDVFKLISEMYAGLQIGYPKIGAGLAGGDWNKIASIIDEELDGEDHTCVEFNG